MAEIRDVKTGGQMTGSQSFILPVDMFFFNLNAMIGSQVQDHLIVSTILPSVHLLQFANWKMAQSK